MINTNSISTMNSAALETYLNDVAARMAGVSEILRHAGETPEAYGNALYLLADVIDDANNGICLSANRVGSLFEAAKAQS